MSGYLPYGGFKWLKNVDNFDVNWVSENSPIGYLLEVDIEYPDELHALHNDNPLAPENLAIPYDMLSDYCKKVAGEYGIKVDDVKKVIPNLGNKTIYVVHYRNLRLYLSLGMKLTKIHKFTSILTLKKEQRLLTVSKKNLFKLFINSFYGKTMENLGKRINIRLVNNENVFFKIYQQTNSYHS